MTTKLESIEKLAREAIQREEDAIPGPWHYDMGNWEIETRNEKYFRQAVGSFAPSNREGMQSESNKFSWDYETPEFICFLVNNNKEMSSAVLEMAQYLRDAIELVNELNKEWNLNCSEEGNKFIKRLSKWTEQK